MTTIYKKQFSKTSIARTLILYIVLFSSLITLIITIAQLYYDYSTELDNIHESIQQIETVHLKSITAAVWAVDRKNAATQFNGILEVPDIEYLEITENNRLWLKAGTQQSNNVLVKNYPLIHISRGQKRVIGNLKVVATLELLYKRLINKAVTILLSNTLKTFLVAAFMFIIFYRLVTRHLLQIADFIEHHDINKENTDLIKLDEDRNNPETKDELGILVTHLNNMQQKINKSFQEIKTSEEKYRRLVELAQEGIWTIDENGMTVFVNPAMANMLGYSSEEMIGKHLFDFMDDHGKEIAAKNMERRRSGIFETHDFEFLRKNGQRMHATLATAPIYEADGKYVGALAGVLDITEKKKAEKDLLLQHNLLEDTVFQRTKALELSNKELEAFSYSVAHDLRTPLRSITSFSQILKEDESSRLSEEGKESLERVIRAGKSMSQLIDELLELSRISRAELNYSSVNLSEIAKNITKHLVNEDPERRAQITIADNLKTNADKTLLELLLQNLIQNAWKFTRKNDTSKIEIGEKRIDGEKVFYVKDNGVGFDMKYKNKLFEAFQRLHDVSYSGNGIGLATVRRILDRHGGKIWAEAKENTGATFYFTIPDKPKREMANNKFKAVS